MTPEEIEKGRRTIIEASGVPALVRLRQRVGQRLGEGLVEVGQLLHVTGHIFGAGRIDRSCKRGNGDDETLVSLTDTTVVNGNTWTRAFSAGPPETWTTTSPVGRVTKTTIDFAGRPLQTSINATPPVSPLSFLYDSHGRLQQTTQRARTWLSGYDSNGYANSQTDPLSHTVSTLNDLDGRPLTTTLQDLREVGTSWETSFELRNGIEAGGEYSIGFIQNWRLPLTCEGEAKQAMPVAATLTSTWSVVFGEPCMSEFSDATS
jgi:hypothetical protein